MQIDYNMESPAPIVVQEIRYALALSIVKNLLENGVIDRENATKVTVALANLYGVNRRPASSIVRKKGSCKTRSQAAGCSMA